MVQFIVFTDFVSQLSFQAKQRKISVLEEFHYSFGSFLKIETEKPILNQFLKDFDFLIQEFKQIKKSP